MAQNKIPKNEYIRKPTGKKNPYAKDVVYGKDGQYKAPLQVTRIPGDAYGTPITMQGVPYPVYGEDNLGHGQIMYPEMNYTFPGNYVTEYPLEQAQMGKAVDNIQIALDAAQLLPVIGEGAYLLSLPFTAYDVGKDIYEGNWKQAGMDAFGFIPSLKAFKYGLKGNKILDTTSKLAKQYQKVNNTLNVANLANDLTKKQEGGLLNDYMHGGIHELKKGKQVKPKRHPSWYSHGDYQRLQELRGPVSNPTWENPNMMAYGGWLDEYDYDYLPMAQRGFEAESTGIRRPLPISEKDLYEANLSPAQKQILLNKQLVAQSQQQAPHTLQQRQPQSKLSKAKEIAINPFTAATNLYQQGYLPDYFSKGPGNYLDIASQSINPVAVAEDIYNLPKDIREGNYTTAGLNLLQALPIAGVAAKKFKNINPSALGNLKSFGKEAVKSTIRDVAQAVDQTLITPIKFRKDIKDIKNLYSQYPAKFQTEEGIRRLNELGIDPANMTMPKLMFNPNEGSSYYALDKPVINIDLRQIQDLKSKGYKLPPGTVLEHELGHHLQQEAYKKQYLKDLFEYDKANEQYKKDVEGWKKNNGKIYEKPMPPLKPFLTSNPTNIDSYLRMLTPKNDILPLIQNDFEHVGSFVHDPELGMKRPATPAEKSWDYFNYRKGKGVERLAHLREMRNNMLKEGIINDIYEPITGKHVLDYITDPKKSKGDRIVDFVDPKNPYNIQILSETLNNLPSYIGPMGLGIGAASALSGNKEEGKESNKFAYGGDPSLPDLTGHYQVGGNWGTPQQMYNDSLNLWKAYQFQKTHAAPGYNAWLYEMGKSYPGGPEALRKVREKNKGKIGSVYYNKESKANYFNKPKNYDPIYAEEEPIVDYYKRLKFTGPTQIGVHSSPDIWHKYINPVASYNDGSLSPVYKKPVHDPSQDIKSENKQLVYQEPSKPVEQKKEEPKKVESQYKTQWEFSPGHKTLNYYDKSGKLINSQHYTYDNQVLPHTVEQYQTGGEADMMYPFGGQYTKTHTHFAEGGVSTNDALRTWDLGEYEGQHETEDMKALIKKHEQNPDMPVPGGETFNQFKERVVPGFKKLLNELPDNALIITHSHLGKVKELGLPKIEHGHAHPLQVGNKTIYVAYHGHTPQNDAVKTHPDEIRSKDVPLAEKGKREAQKLGETLRNKNISVIVSSPLPRAHQTALIVASVINENSNTPTAKRGGMLHPVNETNKNIKSSINYLMRRNETLFGPPGKHYYNPHPMKKYYEGGIAFPQQPPEKKFYEQGWIPPGPRAFYQDGGAQNYYPKPELTNQQIIDAAKHESGWPVSNMYLVPDEKGFYGTSWANKADVDRINSLRYNNPQGLADKYLWDLPESSKYNPKFKAPNKMVLSNDRVLQIADEINPETHSYDFLVQKYGKPDAERLKKAYNRKIQQHKLGGYHNKPGFYQDGGIAFPQQPTEPLFFSGAPWMPTYGMGGLPGGANEMDMPCMNCGGYMQQGGFMSPANMSSYPVFSQGGDPYEYKEGGNILDQDQDDYLGSLKRAFMENINKNFNNNVASQIGQEFSENYPVPMGQYGYDMNYYNQPNMGNLNNLSAMQKNMTDISGKQKQAGQDLLHFASEYSAAPTYTQYSMKKAKYGTAYIPAAQDGRVVPGMPSISADSPLMSGTNYPITAVTQAQSEDWMTPEAQAKKKAFWDAAANYDKKWNKTGQSQRFAPGYQSMYDMFGNTDYRVGRVDRHMQDLLPYIMYNPQNTYLQSADIRKSLFGKSPRRVTMTFRTYFNPQTGQHEQVAVPQHSAEPILRPEAPGPMQSKADVRRMLEEDKKHEEIRRRASQQNAGLTNFPLGPISPEAMNVPQNYESYNLGEQFPGTKPAVGPVANQYQFGGDYETGVPVELTENEIQQIMAAGGSVTYID